MERWRFFYFTYSQRLSIMEVKWMSEAMLWSRTGSLNGSFHHKQEYLPSRLSSSFHGVFWVWDSKKQVIGTFSHLTFLCFLYCFEDCKMILFVARNCAFSNHYVAQRLLLSFNMCSRIGSGVTSEKYPVLCSTSILLSYKSLN